MRPLPRTIIAMRAARRIRGTTDRPPCSTENRAGSTEGLECRAQGSPKWRACATACKRHLMARTYTKQFMAAPGKKVKLKGVSPGFHGHIRPRKRRCATSHASLRRSTNFSCTCGRKKSIRCSSCCRGEILRVKTE